MDVKELVEKLGLKVLCGENLEKEISGCYCGDLLSWVMSRANEGDVWLTVMGNINSVGVAVLADVACIVLTENAALDEDALNRAKQNDVIILQTDKNSYQMAAAISKLI
ncbi:MAG: AraC family transcriptional regulator [Clostridia bacterium]|nr:AraC family transcriptional regulator [Clostridia bacterium]